MEEKMKFNHSPILVLGAGGMLGRAWTATLRSAQLPFRSVTRAEIDYTDPRRLHKLLESRFSWVINCSGFTDVDRSEIESESAYESNAHFVGRLGQLCGEKRVGVVHYSSDYVFDGNSNKPYSVEQPAKPLNVYGKSKAEGERLLLDSGCRSLVVRTSWLFADHGSNFLLTILRLLREKEELQVVADQVGRPTCAYRLVSASLGLLQRNQIGVHHVANSGHATWFDFAMAIRDASRFDCHIRPCSTDEFPRPADRPSYSVLDISRAEKVLGAMPHWKPDVESTVARVLSAKSNHSKPNTLPLKDSRSEQPLNNLLEPTT
jgi:dTDP-4-dehydrorhamnose reductase